MHKWYKKVLKFELFPLLLKCVFLNAPLYLFPFISFFYYSNLSFINIFFLLFFYKIFTKKNSNKNYEHGLLIWNLLLLAPQLKMYLPFFLSKNHSQKWIDKCCTTCTNKHNKTRVGDAKSTRNGSSRWRDRNQ